MLLAAASPLSLFPTTTGVFVGVGIGVLVALGGAGVKVGVAIGNTDIRVGVGCEATACCSRFWRMMKTPPMPTNPKTNKPIPNNN